VRERREERIWGRQGPILRGKQRAVHAERIGRSDDLLALRKQFESRISDGFEFVILSLDGFIKRFVVVTLVGLVGRVDRAGTAYGVRQILTRTLGVASDDRRQF